MHFKKKLLLAMMTLTALGATAQVDMHCHAVTDGYRSFVTDHGAAMDEGFPLPQ